MPSSFNPINFLLDFIETLGQTANLLWDWLFEPITIGSWTFTPILAIGGGILITLLIAKLIKDFIPVA